MPSEVVWYIENAVGLVRHTGEITARDIKAYNRTVIEMVESQDERDAVHFIHDATASGRTEANIQTIVESLKSSARHPRVGWTISYGNNPMSKFLLSMTGHLLSLKIKAAGTFEEAVAMLYDLDDSLPPLPQTPPGNEPGDPG